MKVYLVTTEHPGDHYPLIDVHSVWATSELAKLEAAWVRENGNEFDIVHVDEWEVQDEVAHHPAASDNVSGNIVDVVPFTDIPQLSFPCRFIVGSESITVLGVVRDDVGRVCALITERG
jgi:hypothetical protein